jgi:hypothetical protein
MKPYGKDNPRLCVHGIAETQSAIIKNKGMNPLFFILPRKPAYPSGTTISDPLVYNNNESEPNPLKQSG